MKKLVYLTACLSLGIFSNFYAMHPKEAEFKNVNRHVSQNSETYYATLPNGDTIACDYFLRGPGQGQIHCTRSIYKEDDFISIPLPSHYFHVLKAIFQQQEKSK